MKKTLLSLAAVVFIFGTSLTAADYEISGSYVPNRIIVKFKNAAAIVSMASRPRIASCDYGDLNRDGQTSPAHIAILADQ
ncbi:MAG: hypothetical protein JW787_13160 [Sedimentisphaerales bacterium]|nr:hypothetical protein [Sedimentisphaerales bacterium]